MKKHKAVTTARYTELLPITLHELTKAFEERIILTLHDYERMQTMWRELERKSR